MFAASRLQHYERTVICHFKDAGLLMFSPQFHIHPACLGPMRAGPQGNSDLGRYLIHQVCENQFNQFVIGFR